MLPSCSQEPVGEHIMIVGSLAVGTVASCRLARFGLGRVFAGALCIIYSFCLAGWLVAYARMFMHAVFY